MLSTRQSPPFLQKKQLLLKQVSIVTRRNTPAAAHYAEKIEDLLKNQNINVIQEHITANCDLIIVLGGDGTLLHIAEQAARYGIPVLGINFGTLGFLSDRTEAKALQALEKIMQEEICIENRLMLQVRILTKGKEPSAAHYLLNDVVIAKNSALDPVLNLKSTTDNEFIATYKADGLIFSTPTGSTAYNLSAGGPLVYPGLCTITVTPICPFMLSSRPIILPANKRLLTQFATNSNSPAQVIIDGKNHWQLHEEDILEIVPASHTLQLAVTSNRNYFTVLRNKLHWGKETKGQEETTS